MKVGDVLKRIFLDAPLGIVILDVDGRIIQSNDFFRKISAAVSMLKGEFLSDLFQPEELSGYKDFFCSVLEGKEKEQFLNIMYKHVKGTPGWLRLCLSVIDDTDSKYLVGYLEEITEQKNRESRLLEAKELSEEAKGIAERAVKTKSDFLANMSHEIRTPIHTIIGMSELLADTKLDQEQQEYSSQIQFSADVLLSLINDILDFSKIEAGKLTLEEVDFNLVTTVENAVDMVALEAHKRGLETAVFIENDVPHLLKGDPVRLRQIIVNLFNNAVKFTHRGSVFVKVKHVGDDNGLSELRFCVEDTGIGIPEDKRIRLFKAFSQVDSTTTRKYGGTGLGLSISKNLASMMGGSIGVESEEGGGSTFWFTVKLKKQELQPVIEPANPLDLRVLVVDDNPEVRDILRHYIEPWGCEVFEASSGHEALDFLRAGEALPVDLCLVDLLMPGMDGWQLASEIHSDDRISSVKRILLSPTGKSGEEAKMKLLNWFSGYLHKPVKKYMLLLEMLRILGREDEMPKEEGIVEEEEPSELTEEVAPGNILVAEDHKVNQMLFKTILENIGHRVTLAGDGIEAVDAVKNETFDIIFMDVQMPRMNGYEATEEIRKLGIKTPVIAVTASAIKGERERCINAGMTDFLTKPFKKKDLVPVLERWLESGSPNLEVDVPAEVEELEEIHEYKVSDTDIFDMEAAVEVFMGKKDLVLSLLKDLVPRIDGQIAKIEKCIGQSDMGCVRSEAHSIKGSCSNMFIKRLSEDAASLEKCAAGNGEDAKALLERLKKSFEEFAGYCRLNGLT